MIPTMVVEVETTYDRRMVKSIDGLPSTYSQTYYMKDEFKQLQGDGQARISVGTDERFSGPYGTYSSVSVSVNITLTCDQTKTTIDKAAELAFDYCSDFLDRHAVPSLRLLTKHLEVMQKGEENG